MPGQNRNTVDLDHQVASSASEQVQASLYHLNCPTAATVNKRVLTVAAVGEPPSTNGLGGSWLFQAHRQVLPNKDILPFLQWKGPWGFPKGEVPPKILIAVPLRSLKGSRNNGCCSGTTFRAGQVLALAIVLARPLAQVRRLRRADVGGAKSPHAPRTAGDAMVLHNLKVLVKDNLFP
jgi:hypothetical protein